MIVLNYSVPFGIHLIGLGGNYLPQALMDVHLDTSQLLFTTVVDSARHHAFADGVLFFIFP